MHGRDESAVDGSGVRAHRALEPGKAARHEHEYVRNGVPQIFLAVEPLTGRCHVEVSEGRTRRDWARWIRAMLVTRYPEAERVEIHYTPKHGGWLNVAEVELSVLSAQCLNRRLAEMAGMQDEIAAWQRDCNHRQGKIDWRFTTSDARIKLKRLSPTF